MLLLIQNTTFLNCYGILIIDTGQGRLDGAFCKFSSNDKMSFLRKLSESGVKNMEMESTAFAALTHEAGVRAAVVCVTLLNRLNGDQVDAFQFSLH